MAIALGYRAALRNCPPTDTGPRQRARDGLTEVRGSAARSSVAAAWGAELYGFANSGVERCDVNV